MKKSEMRLVNKELPFYKVNKASKNKFDAKFEVWRLNKAKGFYNFVRYTNDDSQENINKIILEDINKRG